MREFEESAGSLNCGAQIENHQFGATIQFAPHQNRVKVESLFLKNFKKLFSSIVIVVKYMSAVKYLRAECDKS